MIGTILIVDDNKSLVDVLKLDLELRGHKVFSAFDGEEGEKLITEIKPDAVILDVMLPKKNGYAVCRDVKRDANLSKIPIILLTAKSTKEDIYWGHDCGADAYVTKPYESRELIMLVEQLMNDYKEGKRSFSWTGLRDYTVIEKEAKMRLDAGADVLLLDLEYDEEQKEAFIQKYGYPRFRDLTHSLAWGLNNAICEISTTSIIGQYADDTFVVMTTPKDLEEIKAKIIETSNKIIEKAYDLEDRKNKGILKKDLQSNKEVLIPIMTFILKKR